jgi:hypothetical protein
MIVLPFKIFPDSNYFLYEQEYLEEHEKFDVNNPNVQNFLNNDTNDSESDNQKLRKVRKTKRRLKRSLDLNELDKLTSDPSVSQKNIHVVLFFKIGNSIKPPDLRLNGSSNRCHYRAKSVTLLM